MHTKNTEQYASRLHAALVAADWPLLTRLCRQVLRKNSRDLKAHRLLGFALSKQRKFEAALQAYRQAHAYWPGDAELLINYANVLIEQAQNQDATFGWWVGCMWDEALPFTALCLLPLLWAVSEGSGSTGAGPGGI